MKDRIMAVILICFAVFFATKAVKSATRVKEGGSTILIGPVQTRGFTAQPEETHSHALASLPEVPRAAEPGDDFSVMTSEPARAVQVLRELLGRATGPEHEARRLQILEAALSAKTADASMGQAAFFTDGDRAQLRELALNEAFDALREGQGGVERQLFETSYLLYLSSCTSDDVNLIYNDTLRLAGVTPDRNEIQALIQLSSNRFPELRAKFGI